MTSPRALLVLPALLFLPFAAYGQATTGWRNDGSGKYPDATPPTTWGRVSKPIRDLRYQATKPGDADAGAPMSDGLIRDWLVLTPAVDDAVELPPCPTENERSGNSVWKKVTLETAWLDFQKIIGKSPGSTAFAATNVWSESGGKFRVSFTQLGAVRIVLNGKQLPNAYGRISIDLNKGWNRLLLKVAARENDWACTFSLHARAPAEFTDANIAWRLALPGVNGGFYGGGMGCASPVIVGNRMYVLGEPHDLFCIDKDNGRLLWSRTSSYVDAATPEDRKHPAFTEAQAADRALHDMLESLATKVPDLPYMEKKAALEKTLYAKMQEIDPVRYKRFEVPDVGHSGMTPVSDGKFLYLWLGTGVTACYDLDGNRRWIRVDNLPAVEHGFSSSPLLVDGKVIVFMRDLFAFDAATGNLAWRIPVVSHEGANPGGYFHGTPVRIVVGGVPLIVLGNGTVVRAADGKVLSTHKEMGNQAISSPVVDRNLLFETTTGSMKLFIHELPTAPEPFACATRTVSVATPTFPHYYMPWHMASPLIHDGLAYLLNNAGVLTVVDVAEGRVLYQQMLDIDSFQTSNEGPARGVGVSPTLAGKYLYILGNNGAAVVLEPGRTFRQVAKNKIESLVSVGHWGERAERFISNPVFDGGRLYIRGEGHLYAIGPKSTSAVVQRTADAAAPALEQKGVAPRRPAPAADPVLPEDSAPLPYGWRRNGSGIFAGVTPPTEWTEKKNIRWRAEVGKGQSSPVVVGDRVIVVSEPGLLVCLNRADGAVQWKAAIGGDLPAAKEWARPTPVSDGKHLYLSLGDGTVASYALEGQRRWTQSVEPAALGYGSSASPVLAGDLVLVDGKRLKALEAATGKVRWSADASESHYGTPAILTLDGTAFAVTAKGSVVRVSDGTVVAKGIAEGLGGDQAPSPVVRGSVVYFAYARCSAVKLAYKDGRLTHEKLWEQELQGDVIASPIVKDGLLHVVPFGSPDYRVLDATTGAVLLEKELDLDPNVYPSLALAGGKLYIGNDEGAMLVLDPGTSYKEIGRGKLPKGSGASPAFWGAHVFVRGGEFLYCVGP